MPNASLTRDQAREIDRLAMEEYGVRGLILMENAGRRCACMVEKMVESVDAPQVSLFCGGGNNGGDGFVIARHPWNHGLSVHVYVVGEVHQILEKDTDASVNLEIVRNMDIPIAEITSDAGAKDHADKASESDLVVDALLGTGIAGDVRGHFRPLIEDRCCRTSGRRRLI
ncbi:MAG: NAD(P)H-hydrate epimerase [Planctomycetota bacterium]